jgi:hypothetical protein
MGRKQNRQQKTAESTNEETAKKRDIQADYMDASKELAEKCVSLTDPAWFKNPALQDNEIAQIYKLRELAEVPGKREAAVVDAIFSDYQKLEQSENYYISLLAKYDRAYMLMRVVETREYTKLSDGIEIKKRTRKVDMSNTRREGIDLLNQILSDESLPYCGVEPIEDICKNSRYLIAECLYGYSSGKSDDYTARRLLEKNIRETLAIKEGRSVN